MQVASTVVTSEMKWSQINTCEEEKEEEKRESVTKEEEENEGSLEIIHQSAIRVWTSRGTKIFLQPKNLQSETQQGQ